MGPKPQLSPPMEGEFCRRARVCQPSKGRGSAALFLHVGRVMVMGNPIPLPDMEPDALGGGSARPGCGGHGGWGTTMSGPLYFHWAVLSHRFALALLALLLMNAPNL